MPLRPQPHSRKPSISRNRRRCRRNCITGVSTPTFTSAVGALYYRKGGHDPEFNWSPVVLTAADLDRLEADIKAKRLPRNRRLLFGESDGSEIDDDLAFVVSARAAITAGKTVFYIASW